MRKFNSNFSSILNIIGPNENYVAMLDTYNLYLYNKQVMQYSGGVLRLGDDLATSGNEQLVINNGNVGIGTTTPSQKLDVNGTSIFRGQMDLNSNKIINLANGTLAQDAVTKSQLDAVNSALSGNVSDNYVPYTGATKDVDLGENNLSVGGNVELDVNKYIYLSQYRDTGIRETSAGNVEYISTNGGSQGHIFITNDTERLRITNSGNVGIGTTSPDVKLDVSGQIVSKMYGSSGQEILDWPNPAIGVRRYETSTNAIKMISLGYRDDPLYQTGHAVWNFAIDTGSETSRATSNSNTDLEIGGPGDVHFLGGGNIGIGTTNPSQKLEIYNVGNAGIKVNSTNAAWLTLVGSSGTTTLSQYSDGTTRLGNQANSATEQLVLTSQGNVGIGTTTPSQKLEVAGNANVTQNLTISGMTIYKDTNGDMVFRA
jgi:hypothetical protein